MRRFLSTLLLTVNLVAGAEPDFFASDQVVAIEIRIPDSGITRLKTQPREEVPAQLTCAGQKFTEAKVRLKGNGSFRPITDKPSFSIRLGPGKFHGRQRLLLNNSAQDSSFLRWKLASEIFLRHGVPTARINFARVKLNDRDLGLYLLLEPTDKVFLKRHFGSAQGNLYEGSNNDVADRLEQDHGEPGSDQADLATLAAACAEPDLAQRWQRLRAVLDVDHFVSFMALEVLVGHRDGYSLDRNNFRIYHHPRTDRLVFIPHGLDLIFNHPEFPREPRFSGMVARALDEVPEGRQAFQTRVRELGQKIYGNHALVTRLEQLQELIKSALVPGHPQASEDLRYSLEAWSAFMTKGKLK
jgi:spore coat protein H